MRITYMALISSLIFSASSFVFPVWANDHQHHAMMPTTPSAATTAVYQTTGIVKQWDTNSVTLSHAPIAELKWPAMTMAFALPSRGGITPLSVNTPVTFSFIQNDSGYTLTAITPQQP
ncbi:copper-binding protein [Pectobacterium brasiliense]|uniref:copper-binding protein n=1 Tax=Pectobacterium brasiliense TaxID=180957 RepID=UPI00057E1BB0|nr:copper-binding protein [Pectobacterium brasiliense]APS29345.1 cation transporter [Pectobacterium brasiliense]KHS98704.1 cation transporter [Pectobacterium brasiliense]MBN3099914.1 copper-binding protein [Pectobacterium brasiliense]MBN3101152.1 copper-binding protein [Pectobacterium brasiliense]MBN3167552.1 copper-binding protein [Pectobacterium brasiliense]